MPRLGAWLAAFGCIRFRHLERSLVERISQSTVHCYCKKAGYLATDLEAVWTYIGAPVVAGARMLLALEDWTDRTGQSTAHGYAASKYTLSLRAELAILSGARDL